MFMYIKEGDRVIIKPLIADVFCRVEDRCICKNSHLCISTSSLFFCEALVLSMRLVPTFHSQRVAVHLESHK